jgi:signal-transduction protein with cAMP-binding, CBS, and nucleotidyltransferase domain
VGRGDPGDAIYVIVSGAAEVDVGGRFHRLGPGDFFGETAVLAGKRREATVRAVEPVAALRLPADGLQAFLLENPKVALGMLKSLVERLREVQDRLDTWIGGVGDRPEPIPDWELLGIACLRCLWTAPNGPGGRSGAARSRR